MAPLLTELPETSSKSRAGRRAKSPSADPEKSLKAAPEEYDLPEQDLSVLSARSGAGIVKKSKKQKPLSRQQRLRKEKGMARADIVTEKLEKKVDVSRKKGKLIKERAAAWEELNSAPAAKPAKKAKPPRPTKADVEMEDASVSVLMGEGQTNGVGPATSIPGSKLDGQSSAALGAVDMIT